MTEQLPPSAEALPLALRWPWINVVKFAHDIDALIAQRVSDETERCACIAVHSYHRTPLEIARAIRAPAERPSPETVRNAEGAILKMRDWTECECPRCGRLHWKTHERPAPVVDYTERAQEWKDSLPKGLIPQFVWNACKIHFAAALSAVASKHQAAIAALHDDLEKIHEELIQARRERDAALVKLARLREQEMREAVKTALSPYLAGLSSDDAAADAVLAVVKEKLS